ncbi:MAG: hypothetical protein AAFR04_04445 [Pseudomonadota bacterium]
MSTSAMALALGLSLALLPVSVTPAHAQSSLRDAIADLLSGGQAAPNAKANQPNKPAQPNPLGPQTPRLAQKSTTPGAAPNADPREGDLAFEQAKKLMRAVDNILKDAAKNRSDARKLPSRNDFLVTPIWTETREDRKRRINDLLDAVLGIVTDAPVVDVQKRIEKLRKNIRENEDQIVALREKQLTAPKDAMLPGILTDTVDSLGTEIEDAKKRIENNKAQIATAKKEIYDALRKSGVDLSPDQADMLLGSVLSGDMIRLVAAFKAAKVIDRQLGKLVGASGDNLKAARKYFAMHAALFAMLVHAQDGLITKIDKQYMPKLRAIEKDIKAARQRTKRLLRATNRDDQSRTLRANLESQRLAMQAAKGYRTYLLRQREQLARARRRATHDLRIADNTYETVEASFQLRNLMRNSRASFEAIQRLEAPTFDQIFKNEALRREFENLTKKLEVPTS